MIVTLLLNRSRSARNAARSYTEVAAVGPDEATERFGLVQLSLTQGAWEERRLCHGEGAWAQRRVDVGAKGLHTDRQSSDAGGIACSDARNQLHNDGRRHSRRQGA